MESDYTTVEWLRIDDEFKRLKDTVYLDHAGTALYSEVQLANVYRLLGGTLLSNPHTSKNTDDLLDQVRFRVLRWLNASADDYSVVFTSGATAALKMVAECFAFSRTSADAEDETDDKNDCPRTDRGQFAYLTDNHTSVLGMRAIVNTERISGVSFSDFKTRCDLIGIEEQHDCLSVNTDPDHTNSLFVYPGQCNFSGYKYPLDAIHNLQRYGPLIPAQRQPQNTTNWFVMLDAASLVATGRLDLSRHCADFVCISFYKLFGYPTGLGALLISRRGARVLRKRYYGGGTVQIALASHDWHRKRSASPLRRLHERYEDGTVSFLSVAAVLAGFETMERLVPGATAVRIERHCYAVARHLYAGLSALRYANDAPVVRLYHDDGFESCLRQGGIVNFNVLHANGSVVGFRELAEIAEVYGVRLRTGCFCNPGACQRHLRLSDAQVRRHFAAGHVCGDSVDMVDGVPTGSVRVSCGYITRKSDVEQVLRMIEDTYVKASALSADKSIVLPHSIAASTTSAVGALRLLEICVFPIKSCAAHRVLTGRWPLTERGLRYDREWMIVNGRTGVALTQKTCIRMCLVRPRIDDATGRMWLEYPDYDKTVNVPLKEEEIGDDDAGGKAQLRETTLCISKVCGDRVEGIDCGNVVAAWLAEVLCESDVRLIRQRAGDGRQCSNQTVQRRRRRRRNDVARGKSHREEDETIGAPISLVNQAPFLLINRLSVRWLSEQVDAWTEARDTTNELSQSLEENTIARFRGNLIVGRTKDDGSRVDRDDGALQELDWQRIRVGRVAFRVQGPCTRCQMICIDQTTGEKTTEPLRTIAKVFGGKMRFGVYLEYDADGVKWPGLHEACDDDENRVFLTCGDRVHLLEQNTD